MANRYWFARHRIDYKHNRGMAPVTREGWLVVLSFVAAMVAGGIGMLWLTLSDQVFLGVTVFVLFAVAGGAMFIALAYRRGDMAHTVADYRSGRVRDGVVVNEEAV